MSTSVTHPGAATGRPGRFFGMAMAALAVVIAIGVGFAISQDDSAQPSAGQPAHPMVSDAHRAKAELLAERKAQAEALAYQEHIDFLRYRGQGAWSQDYQEHIDFLRYQDRGAWSQEYQEQIDFLRYRELEPDRGRVGGR